MSPPEPARARQHRSLLTARAKVGAHVAVPYKELRAEIRESLFRDWTVDSEDLVASSGFAS